MTLDPRIPMMGQGIDLGQIMQQAQQRQMNQMRVEEYHEGRENKRRLSELLPEAVKGNREAIDGIAGIDPDMFMRLDDRQRKLATERTADLTQAVRWADTPEKWEQVIDHYAKEGVDLSQYRGQFGQRERAMLELGKIGDYLGSAPQEKILTPEAGAGAFAYDPTTRQMRVLVQPNDGSAPMGTHSAPSGGGGIPQGAVDMLRSNPGLKADFDAKYGPGASDQVLGGQTPQASGNFPR